MNYILYSVPSRVRTPSSPLSCNFCRLRDDFDDDGQLDSIAPKAPSTARRRWNHLEVLKVAWQRLRGCPHSRWDRAQSLCVPNARRSRRRRTAGSVRGRERGRATTRASSRRRWSTARTWSAGARCPAPTTTAPPTTWSGGRTATPSVRSPPGIKQNNSLTLSEVVDALVTFVMTILKIRDDFYSNGQLDSIAPRARSNPNIRRRQNHLEHSNSLTTKMPRMSTLSLGSGIKSSTL